MKFIKKLFRQRPSNKSNSTTSRKNGNDENDKDDHCRVHSMVVTVPITQGHSTDGDKISSNSNHTACSDASSLIAQDDNTQLVALVAHNDLKVRFCFFL